MLYGINTWALKQAILSVPETAISFTYLLIIKDASTFKDTSRHDHHATGKAIPDCENCTLTTRFLSGKFQERLLEIDRKLFLHYV